MSFLKPGSRHPYIRIWLIFLAINLALVPLQFIMLANQTSEAEKNGVALLFLVINLAFWACVALIFLARRKSGGHRAYH